MASPPARRQQRRQRLLQIEAIEDLRYSLPVNQYLAVLHGAAVQGKIPDYDDTGKLTGEFRHISAKDQIDCNKFLIEKAMPSRRIAMIETEEVQTDIPAEEDFRGLSRDQLNSLVYGADGEAPHPIEATYELEPDT